MRKNRIFTVHLGCSKNQVDAECLVTEFLYQGFETANSAEETDYILINTCGFIFKFSIMRSTSSVVSIRLL